MCGVAYGAAYARQGRWGEVARSVTVGAASGLGASVAGKVIAKHFAPKPSLISAVKNYRAAPKSSPARRVIAGQYVGKLLAHHAVKKGTTAIVGNSVNFGLAVRCLY